MSAAEPRPSPEPSHRPPAIVRWRERSDPGADLAAIEAIFFAASRTQSFADAAERDRFRERWLGRYLEHDPDLVWLAVGARGEVIGYLVGALDDPARAPRFADIGYFAELAPITARHPAHLHINLEASHRGRGIGRLLIEAFADDVARRGIDGLHVVTGAGARNVGFYRRCGFSELAHLEWGGQRLVALGRRARRAEA